MEEGESTNNKSHSPLKNRRAGIILHPTSLPGLWDNGDLGEEAYRFIDFLAAAGQKVWQILPLGPTHADGSPYQCLSVYAGNPELVSIELLTEWGWLSDQYTPNKDSKKALLQRVLNHFEETAEKQLRSEFETFVSTNAYWLKDYALYRVLKDERGDLPWYEWPVPLRDRELKSLLIAQEQHAAAIKLVSFEQFVFARQWQALKAYANERGIDVFGDMPIFVAYDSADVWAQREYFSLDKNGQPQVVAGVPP
ncbi:MAG: 4-alpha-glucanotransferase, partial [Gammaproteobacteria bacterium]|nr:4-alpha-glucanotransferase [Gammaproteobacteria bacterium]